MPTKLNTEMLAAALEGYQEQKKRIDAQIAELRQMLHARPMDDSIPKPVRPRKISAAARKRMAAAQRARWAASRNESGTASKPGPATTPKKRKLSAAGRRAIIEATKRRWAAFRAAQKPAKK